MSELFDEVDEEVRRDQLKKLWDLSLIYIVAGAVVDHRRGGWLARLSVSGGQESSRGWQSLRRRPRTFRSKNKHAEAEAAFNSLAATAPSGYRMLARLRAAAEVATRDTQAAAKLFDEIAADRSVGVAGAGSGADSRRAVAAGKRRLSRHETRASKPLPRRGRPSVIPRANCWRCRHGAPTTPRRRGNGWM